MSKRSEGNIKGNDKTKTSIDAWDVSDPKGFQSGSVLALFKRLRAEDPVHFCPESPFGAYWSITKFKDICEIEKNTDVFSSAAGSVFIWEPQADLPLPSFVQMDPPQHTAFRIPVEPAFSKESLLVLKEKVQWHVDDVLDHLPVNQPFDWVSHVSIELTSRVLAQLLNFPLAEKHKLVRWSDICLSSEVQGGNVPEEERREALSDCLDVFKEIFQKAQQTPPVNDFISLLAHHENTRDMDDFTLLGQVLTLIVAGSDTTRNSMSGSIYFMDQYPEALSKLKRNVALLPSMVSEVIRYQTPIAHMRRTAMKDYQIGEKTIKQGDKVVLWYLSGNRDESEIPNADQFIIDRPMPNYHLSFGHGIHHCMGSRIAHLQLQTLWTGILQRFERINVEGSPTYIQSNFRHGFETLPVRIMTKA